jgi:hypothetical protein
VETIEQGKLYLTVTHPQPDVLNFSSPSHRAERRTHGGGYQLPAGSRLRAGRGRRGRGSASGRRRLGACLASVQWCQRRSWTAAVGGQARQGTEDASWSREVGERAGAGGRTTQRRGAFGAGRLGRAAGRQAAAGRQEQVISYFLNCNIEYDA